MTDRIGLLGFAVAFVAVAFVAVACFAAFVAVALVADAFVAVAFVAVAFVAVAFVAVAFVAVAFVAVAFVAVAFVAVAFIAVAFVAVAFVAVAFFAVAFFADAFFADAFFAVGLFALVSFTRLRFAAGAMPKHSVELENLATLERAKLTGVTDLTLTSCAPACVAQLPTSLEKLELRWGTIPSPLRLDHLTRLKSLSVSPTPHQDLAIDGLPSTLEELVVWSSTVERLPDPLPPLKALDFHCCDLSRARLDRLPSSLVSLHHYRCILPEPLTLPDLPSLKATTFFACNLTDARHLLAQPKLESASLELSPLDEESLAALEARSEDGVDIFGVKPAHFELTRQLYAMGVNLSAEKQGTKKIRLHSPLMPCVQDYPREDVMALAKKVEKQKGKSKLSGRAFIDELGRLRYEAYVARKAAKKAARDAAKKPARAAAKQPTKPRRKTTSK